MKYYHTRSTDRLISFYLPVVLLSLFCSKAWWNNDESSAILVSAFVGSNTICFINTSNKFKNELSTLRSLKQKRLISSSSRKTQATDDEHQLLLRLQLSTPSSSSEKEPEVETVAGEDNEDKDIATNSGKAATGTINERLMAELDEAQLKRKSSISKKYGLGAFQSTKTDEERELAIAEARDLNGVNPLVAITGSLFALGISILLWIATGAIGEYFSLHPIESEGVYFVERVQLVVRNIIIGLVSLASGFFGVTGTGILLLGLRVAYGVVTGELDPTPIKRTTQRANEMKGNFKNSDAWDLMRNKKPGRRGGGGKNLFD